MSRDQKEICGYCRYWEPNSRKDIEANPSSLLIAPGRCRLRAPELVRAGNEHTGFYSTTEWPSAEGGDWCGQFSERRDDWQSVGDAANQALANLRKRMDERKP